MATRILIIEDNPANMELMKYLLEVHGYDSLIATDGQGGIDAIHDHKPDLVLCDVQLPVKSGYEVVREIKNNPDLSHIPMIAVTAFAMAEDRQKTLTAGFDDYFTKPINPETFIKDIEKFLKKEFHDISGLSVSGTTAGMPQQLQRRTILIVDDRQVNLDLATSLLEGSGYKVVTAQRMNEALEQACRILPDLILSDVVMKNDSGFEFIKMVKADPQLSSIPFIFITSTLNSEEYREKGLALGAEKFLFRPLEVQELLKEIESCLRKNTV